MGQKLGSNNNEEQILQIKKLNENEIEKKYIIS